MNENTIIQSVIDGDIDIYEQLVSRYHIGVIIHCERITGDRQAAEDIAQEAFIKAYLRLRDFDSNKSKFSTWLYKIATNKAIDYLRSQKRVLPSENIDEIAEAAAPNYEAADEARRLRSTVKNLQPPTHRQVIEAYYWQGKSYQQIADELRIPINTVRTWMRRAKIQLRSELS